MRNLSQFQFMYEVPVVHYPGSQRFAKAAFRLGARARTLCPDTKRNVVQTLWCHKFPFNLVQCCHLLSATTNHSETWVKSMALMKSCFRQVPVPTDSTWILPLERVPVPGYCAPVFVQAPLKCYVHFGVRAQAPNPGTKSGRGLREEPWSATSEARSSEERESRH